MSLRGVGMGLGASASRALLPRERDPRTSACLEHVPSHEASHHTHHLEPPSARPIKYGAAKGPNIRASRASCLSKTRYAAIPLRLVTGADRRCRGVQRFVDQCPENRSWTS
ncbi:hypothetical protein FA95DRAFT_772841 [Auriscalpium vulgare]|uniref:Uncharacterized protein n=1 Tax=Auriscalpium vulgare TaxID=40419 RepID=A0ACB8RBX1_9AGAM|nr:hypothetical protein FA95DRAFT_772841 [Auriscalpium vulgare]